jgi:hypothetical protein
MARRVAVSRRTAYLEAIVVVVAAFSIHNNGMEILEALQA